MKETEITASRVYRLTLLQYSSISVQMPHFHHRFQRFEHLHHFIPTFWMSTYQLSAKSACFYAPFVSSYNDEASHPFSCPSYVLQFLWLFSKWLFDNYLCFTNLYPSLKTKHVHKPMLFSKISVRIYILITSVESCFYKPTSKSLLAHSSLF